VLATVTIASLGFAVTQTAVSQPDAFFLLPSRAWEFSAGALLALHQGALRRLPHGLAVALGWAGMAMLLAATGLFDERTPYPGTAALLPVTATLLVLAAGTGRADRGVSTWLATGPMQVIGRHSYSLYLWHWPLIVLAAGGVLPVAPRDAAFAVALSCVLSAITFRYVEQPLRSSTWLAQQRWRSYGLGVALTGLTLAAVLVLTRTPVLHTDHEATDHRTLTPQELIALPTTAVPRNLTPSLLVAQFDLPVVYADGCHLRFEQTTAPACTYGAPDPQAHMLLVGDSHAAQWFPALEQIADDRGWSLTSVTKSACPVPDIEVFNPSLNRQYHECDSWRSDVLERAAADPPDLVFLASFNKGADTGGVDDPQRWLDGLERTLAGLPAASHPVMLADTPLATRDPVACLSDNLRAALRCAPALTEAERRLLDAERDLVEQRGGTYIDLTTMICPDADCPPILANLLMYRDRHHLTNTAARALSAEIGRHLDEIDEPTLAAIGTGAGSGS
jgi:hypothetical protein